MEGVGSGGMREKGILSSTDHRSMQQRHSGEGAVWSGAEALEQGTTREVAGTGAELC